MIRRFLLPLLALAGIVFAGWSVAQGSKPLADAPPVAEPSRPPYASFVAGAGLIEANSENIAVGAPAAGIVASVETRTGVVVKAGDVLFVLDQRIAQAALTNAQAALTRARSERERLAQAPRPEEIPPMAARAAVAAASLEDAKRQLALYEGVPGTDDVAEAVVELDHAKRELAHYESLTDKKVISAEEFDRRRFALRAAQARFTEELDRRRAAQQTAVARLADAQGQLELLKAGAWKPDIAVADSAVEAAKAQVASAQAALDVLTVRAPIAGTILQVSVHAGESVLVGPAARTAVLMGDVETLVVRTDVDENDAWRVHAGAKAQAFVRGNREMSTDLTFVRFEPYVIPKRSLTGDPTERVDTRVLQVLFSFPRAKLPVFIGQQMDVYIEVDGG